jgi:hypothetical protein
MSFENYKPSKSELEEAQEHMTLKQEGMSLQREEDYNAVLKLKNGKKILEDLKNGKIDLECNSSQSRISGKIGDAVIDIHSTTDHKTYMTSYIGQIDGEYIDDKLAETLFEKYIAVARLEDKTPEPFLGIFKRSSNYENNAEAVAEDYKRQEKIKKL